MSEKPWTNHVISVEGKRTHYLEAGSGEPLILLHSGEFGACAEFSWEFNIAELAKHFRVIAPDWLGYGQSEKLFSFENMLEYRVQHIAAFCRALDIEAADFMGSSMGGTTLIGVCARDDNPWPVRRAVLVSGGGFVPENEARDVLNSYDGTIEAMRAVYRTLFRNPAIRDNEAMILRHQQSAAQPGAWECTAAPRFKAPNRPRKPFAPRTPDYSKVRVPVCIMAGRFDNLRLPGYGEELRKQIPRSELIVLDGGHCHQIDNPDEFNALALSYLLRPFS